MTFSGETKTSLAKVPTVKKCCQLALITGFLRFAGSIILVKGKLGVKIVSDNPAAARMYLTLIKEYFGSKTALTVGEEQLRGKLYELTITPDMNSEAILRETGMLGIKEGSNYLTDGIAPAIVKKRCCKKAALRGIFIAAGSISDPKKGKGYHLEIICRSENLAKDVLKLMHEFDIEGKMALRRNKYVVYLKDGEQIEEFLALIGSSAELFAFQNVRITKQMRNTTNRIMNCESANADKAVSASQKHISDIKYIEIMKGLDYLPEKLRVTAQLRLENPELGLSELANLFDPPLTKSGLNNRLKKICQIADNIQKGAC